MVSWLTRVGTPVSVLSFTLLVLLVTISSVVAGPRFKRSTGGEGSPVILVPGDGGSQLEAKLDKPETVHYYCNKKTDEYFSLWLNLELLFPYVLDCWVDNMRILWFLKPWGFRSIYSLAEEPWYKEMNDSGKLGNISIYKLVYDNVTRTTSNSPGVDIRIPGFGNTTHVEWLDPSQISPSSYFYDIVESLVLLGYVRGVDIRGAPYDYRKAPNEMSAYYNDMKNMTMEMYEKSKMPVTFVCHSMGCPVMLYFFNHQTREWKDTYVKALITLGGAWGGAVKALKAYASGENLGVYVINHLAVRTEQRTCPSLAYMAPFDTFWNASEVLVETPNKNYSLSNIHDFYTDIGFADGWEMYQDTYNLTRSLIPPDVEVHCLHGISENTIERLQYKSDFPDTNPDLVFGDGDGTVNRRSLEGCLRFIGNQKQKVYHLPLKNVDHMGILSDKQVLDYVQKVVLPV